jgi:multidrug resistance efflux pump
VTASQERAAQLQQEGDSYRQQLDEARAALSDAQAAISALTAEKEAYRCGWLLLQGARQAAALAMPAAPAAVPPRARSLWGCGLRCWR